MQMLCGKAQESGRAEASVIRRPAGTRDAGQPSRWTRSCENRKRCAAIHPMDSSIRKALETRSEEHTSELQSHSDLVCRLLLEKKKRENNTQEIKIYTVAQA